jgi:hypothetical protein
VVHRILVEDILVAVARTAVEEPRSLVAGIDLDLGEAVPHIDPLGLEGPRTDSLEEGPRSQLAHRTAQVALHNLAVRCTVQVQVVHSRTDHLVDGTQPAHL